MPRLRLDNPSIAKWARLSVRENRKRENRYTDGVFGNRFCEAVSIHCYPIALINSEHLIHRKMQVADIIVAETPGWRFLPPRRRCPKSGGTTTPPAPGDCRKKPVDCAHPHDTFVGTDAVNKSGEQAAVLGGEHHDRIPALGGRHPPLAPAHELEIVEAPVRLVKLRDQPASCRVPQFDNAGVCVPKVTSPGGSVIWDHRFPYFVLLNKRSLLRWGFSSTRSAHGQNHPSVNDAACQGFDRLAAWHRAETNIQAWSSLG